jgi:hypothetical protein
MVRDKSPLKERVTTRRHLRASPQTVWQALMFYEDVPRRPGPSLWPLPRPVRSRGNKLVSGSTVRCTYERGHLLKRITAVEPSHLLSFEVTEQALGIERYARACEGSYRLLGVPEGTEIALTTAYQSRLRPRFLFRPIERYLCHRLHGHILSGMRDHLAAQGLLPDAPSAAPEARADESRALGR